MKKPVIRPAEQADLDMILKIYAHARRFMRSSGNPTQWPDSYPPRELLEEDMERKGLFVVTDGGVVHGVFMFVVGPDPTYERIEDGDWHSDQIYGTIHRIAGDGTGGVFNACLDFCRGMCGYLRIDTHENNRVMRNILSKAGFRRCGIIYTDNGTPRIAYDHLETE